jgi:hypothetical protein
MATKAKTKHKKKIKTDLVKTYGREETPLRLNEQEFRFAAVRPGLGTIPLDGWIESVEWNEEGSEDATELNMIPVLRGSITLRKNHPDSPAKFPTLRDGHRLRCDVKWFGNWKPLWEMRMLNDRLSIEDGSLTFELQDDIAQLILTEGSVAYRKGKKRRKKGYRYNEIVRLICRKYHIPVGSVVAGTEWHSYVKKDVSVLEMIQGAVEAEQKLTGRHMVIRWAPLPPAKKGKNKGKSTGYGLSITPMRRNPILFLFKDQITAASLGHQRNGNLATTIVATGSQKSGKGKKTKRKPIKVVVRSKEGERRYGFIRREIKVGNVEGRASARKLAKRSLAKGLKPIRIVENFSHPGVATVRRGDAIRVSIPEEGYKGKQGIVFVTSVNHSLAGGDYTMTLTLSFIDPLDPNKLRADREKALRAKKARNKKGAVKGAVFNEGDSLAVGSAGPLASALDVKLTTDAAVGRSSAAGVKILKSRKLPDTILVQLGTNDTSVSGFRASVRSVLALPGVSQVYWVNIKRPPLGGTSDSDLNAVLDDEAGSSSKLVIIDWKGLVESQGITLDSAQHIHPTAAGYRKRAELIAKAMS